MEIRKSSSLARLFKGPQHPINEDYAELKVEVDAESFSLKVIE